MREQLRTWILHNVVVSWFYHFKFYMDLGITQISWFSGKLPEIMAVVYFFDKTGYPLSLTGIIVLAVSVFSGLALFGLFLKVFGFFEIDSYVQAKINPVQAELLMAARKINGKNGKVNIDESR